MKEEYVYTCTHVATRVLNQKQYRAVEVRRGGKERDERWNERVFMLERKQRGSMTKPAQTEYSGRRKHKN